MDLEHERRLTEVEARSKSNTRRLDELQPLTEELHKMSKATVEIVNELKHTNKDVRDIKEKVDMLEEKPAKRWDTATTVLITVLITSIVNYLISVML